MKFSHQLFIEESEGIYETALYGFSDEEATELAMISVSDAQAMELWDDEGLVGSKSNKVEDTDNA